MDKIAIISDIHGNLEALKSVLEDIRNRGIDKIYCIGDIIFKGVHSSECLKLVRENCQVILQGNCDDYFTKEHDLSKIDSEVEKTRIKWGQEIITDEERDYLQSLPLTYEFYMSGRLVRIFHANPEDQYRAVAGINSTIVTRRQMFLPSEKTESQKKADVVVFGHIHTQLLNKEYNRTLINCGSVGNAVDYIRNDDIDGNVLETTNADYLIIEGELGSTQYGKPINFQFVRVPYDIEKELSSDIFNPEKESYGVELTTGKYRDMYKVYDALKKEGLNVDDI